MAAIEILGLEKTYMVGFWRKRPKRALQPLHLTVEEGEIFGFLGPNGAGKTTTLKMLMGLVFPTGGTARILDHEWTDPEVKAQIGFLPEQPYFYNGTKSGYSFAVQVGSIPAAGGLTLSYSVIATPQALDITGTRYFCSFEDFVLRSSSAVIAPPCAGTVAPLQ